MGIERTTLALRVAYDGGAYSGFQIQRAGVPTIQGHLERALGELGGKDVRLAGAGRTDAGVHAREQVVSFDWEGTIPADHMPGAINRHLPPDIVAWDCQATAGDFHARYSATGKTYQYTIVTRRFPSPFWRRYALHWPASLDCEAMAEAARIWVGTHDYSSFQVTGRPVSDPTRTVTRLSVERGEGVVRVTISATGFLYKMVRSIVGTLLDMGRGFIPTIKAGEILAGRSRELAGPTAPAHGLCLWSVDYDDALCLPECQETFLPFLTRSTRT